MSAHRTPALGVLLVLAGSVLAEPSKQLESTTPVVEAVVEVEATRLALERQVRHFVEAVTRQIDEESPALWHRQACPFVAGLDGEHGEFVLARIASTARAVGTPLAAGRCRPNLFVVFATDSRALFEAWREREHRLFGSATDAEIERFVGDARPVRAWYNVTRVEADRPVAHAAGTTPRRYDAELLQSAGRVPGSRLGRATVLALDTVIVVVEFQRVRDHALGQVADLVAMLGLAKLEAGPETLDDATILNLLGERSWNPPETLTRWDYALLRALYATDQRHVLQRTHVVRRMVDELGGAVASHARVPNPIESRIDSEDSL